VAGPTTYREALDALHGRDVEALDRFVEHWLPTTVADVQAFVAKLYEVAMETRELGDNDAARDWQEYAAAAWAKLRDALDDCYGIEVDHA
jgi:hypothetical protein